MAPSACGRSGLSQTAAIGPERVKTLQAGVRVRGDPCRLTDNAGHRPQSALVAARTCLDPF